MGTQGYAAPEVIENKNYDPKKCDLWAIGVIIYKLKFNEIPILKFYGNIVPNKFDNEYLDDLVKKLIVVDQSKRINWEDYFNHAFFKTNNYVSNEKKKILIVSVKSQKIIEIDEFSNVSDIKKKIIENNISVNFDDFYLVFNGMALEDNKSIDEYGIEELSFINCIEKFNVG